MASGRGVQIVCVVAEGETRSGGGEDRGDGDREHIRYGVGELGDASGVRSDTGAAVPVVQRGVAAIFTIKWTLFSAKFTQNAPVLGENVTKRRQNNKQYAAEAAVGRGSGVSAEDQASPPARHIPWLLPALWTQPFPKGSQYVELAGSEANWSPVLSWTVKGTCLSVVMVVLTAMDLAAALKVSTTVAMTAVVAVDALSDGATAQLQVWVTATASFTGWRSATLAAPEASQLADAKVMNGENSVRAPRLRGAAAASTARLRLVMPVAPMSAVTLPSVEVSEGLAAAAAAAAAKTAAPSASIASGFGACVSALLTDSAAERRSAPAPPRPYHYRA